MAEEFRAGSDEIGTVKNALQQAEISVGKSKPFGESKANGTDQLLIKKGKNSVQFPSLEEPEIDQMTGSPLNTIQSEKSNFLHITGELPGGSLNKVRLLDTKDGKELVVKYSNPEYRPPLFSSDKFNRISFPAASYNRVALKIFKDPGMTIVPNKEDILRAYHDEFKLMERYFTYNEGDPTARDNLVDGLHNPENPFYHLMKKVLRTPDAMAKAADIVEKHKTDTFLVPEHLIIGHPPGTHATQADIDKAAATPGKNLPVVPYILQEKVQGNDVRPLTEIADRELKENPTMTEKLLMFALLQRLMYFQTGKLIDTRPEAMIGRNGLEWFQKTANILVADGHPTFIDTRWLWNNDTRFIGRKGLNLVDFLGRRSVDRAIKKYTTILQET